MLFSQIIAANRLVTVECYLWAHNIEQRSRYSLDFQIIIGKNERKIFANNPLFLTDF